MSLNEFAEKYGGKRPRLDTPAAAGYLGIGKSTLDKLRLTGGGPAFSKFGRRVVYDADDLDAWSAQWRQTSTSDTPQQRAA